ncbi:aldo/keto reductase [Klebsiella pneumoniae subsp. pneumoniae]|nr:aldo/keto reductase [Klebsiella pneumoniae subsp. pneumoniae]
MTIQNPYSLLNRSFEVGLAEVSQFEGVELLAYSCLAFGTLDRQVSQRCEAGGGAQYAVQPLYALQQRAVAESGSGHVDIAKRHGLDPAQMALAFVRRQPFVASTLLGGDDS